MVQLLMSILNITGTLLYFAWLIGVYVGLPASLIVSALTKSPGILRKSCLLYGVVTVALFTVSLVVPDACRVSGQQAPTRADMISLLAGQVIVAIPMLLPTRLLGVGSWRRLFHLAMVAGAGTVVALAIPMMQKTNSLHSVQLWFGTVWRALVPGGAFVYLTRIYRQISPPTRANAEPR